MPHWGCIGKRGRRWRFRTTSSRIRRRCSRRNLHSRSCYTLNRKRRSALRQCFLLQCPRLLASRCVSLQSLLQFRSRVHADQWFGHSLWAQRTKADGWKAAGDKSLLDRPLLFLYMANAGSNGGHLTDSDYEPDVKASDIPMTQAPGRRSLRHTAHRSRGDHRPLGQSRLSSPSAMRCQWPCRRRFRGTA